MNTSKNLMPYPGGVSIDLQISTVRRELAMRKKAYPKWVKQGRMSQSKADAEIENMQAVLATLEREKERSGIKQGSLFSEPKKSRAYNE